MRVSWELVLLIEVVMVLKCCVLFEMSLWIRVLWLLKWL